MAEYNENLIYVISRAGLNSFNLVKSANISREQIDNHITKEAIKWLRDNFAA